MCIVTGPNIDKATKLIKRLKGILDTKLGLTFNDKVSHLQLNGCIARQSEGLTYDALGPSELEHSFVWWGFIVQTCN